MIQIVSLSYKGAANSSEMTEYRERVRPLLVKYGAERVSSARVLHAEPDDPIEIHVTRFADNEGYAAMLTDPDYLALEDLRNTAMKHVRNYVTEEYVVFLD